MAGLPILQGVSGAGELYSRALSSAYHTEFRLIDPDFSQDREVDIWDKVRRDGKVQQAILQRTSQIAAKNWSLEPGGDSEEDRRLAEIVSELIKNVKDFREARSQLANAVFRGSSYSFIQGERRLLRVGDMPAKKWWVPYRLKHIDKRRVEYLPSVKGKKVRSEMQIFSVAKEGWFKVPPSVSKLIVKCVFANEESRLGYGRGLLEAIYFLWWAKTRVLKEGLQAVERWAQGFLLGKVDTQKAGASGKNPDKQRDEMLDQLQLHRSRHAIVVDAADTIELVTGGGEGAGIVMDYLQYLDDTILATSLGAVLPFGQSADTGSFARAETEQEIADERTEFDRGKVDESLTDNLVKCVVNLNIAQIAESGVLGAKLPRFSTTGQKFEDPEKNVNVVRAAQEVGAKIKKKEFYSRIGWEMPEDGDDTLEPPGEGGGGFEDFGGFGDSSEEELTNQSTDQSTEQEPEVAKTS